MSNNTEEDEEERPIETRESKRLSISITVKKLAIVQVWIGISILCLCFSLSQVIEFKFWFRWIRIDITLCAFIIITGCTGIYAGIYQTSAILNGTYMSFMVICSILTMGILFKNGMGLKDVTSNWTFRRTTDMILYICLYGVFCVEAIYTVSVIIYWLLSVRKISGLPAQGPSRSRPQLPMFVSESGQLMVIPTLQRQQHINNLQVNHALNRQNMIEINTSNTATKQTVQLHNTYDAQYPSTSRAEPPPAYSEENLTWL